MLTREFYALVKEHLAPGGAVASNVPPIRNFEFRLCSPCMRCSRLSMSIRLGANRTKHRAIAVAVSAPGSAAKSLMQCGPCVTEGVRFPLSVARSRRQTRHGAVFKECRRAHGFAPADLYRVIPSECPSVNSALGCTVECLAARLCCYLDDTRRIPTARKIESVSFGCMPLLARLIEADGQ
jgi:hypothetical protein